LDVYEEVHTAFECPAGSFLSDGTWYVFESIIMLFGYSCKSGWLETIRSMVWRRSNGSHQWSKLSKSVSTRIDHESEQLCSRPAEGRALMKLFK
jgi:hypothetical protein